MKRPICGYKVLTGPVSSYNGKPYYIRAKWDGCQPRAPKKGELFISGAIPQAYRATSDMETEYFIAVPIDPATFVKD